MLKLLIRSRQWTRKFVELSQRWKKYRVLHNLWRKWQWKNLHLVKLVLRGDLICLLFYIKITFTRSHPITTCKDSKLNHYMKILNSYTWLMSLKYPECYYYWTMEGCLFLDEEFAATVHYSSHPIHRTHPWKCKSERSAAEHLPANSDMP